MIISYDKVMMRHFRS